MRAFRSSLVAVAAIVSLLPATVIAMSFERGVDRPGSDYTSFDIRGSARTCQAACDRDDQCRAWTYVRAGIQGPAPRCWLKFQVPPPRWDDCCVSGVN